MQREAPNVEVRMGFMPPVHAIADVEHPGLLRAGQRASAPYGGESVEYHECTAVDLSLGDPAQPDSPDVPTRPDLFGSGFDTVDLSGFEALQQTFEGIREAGRITDEDAAAIRAALDGAVLRGSGSGNLTVMHIADEGLIMRRSGPNGLSVGASGSHGMNGHSVATSIHADQDVFGTPLSQLMDGRAPELFRHDSPDGHNHDASLMLVNLWVPLQQITQPLVLADGRSIDRRRHQLRYGLATTSFLERDDDMAVNDIWMFLHDPAQRWYLHSEMDHRSAYVFNTLGTPHGSCTLPGEDVAEQCYLALEKAESAVVAEDSQALLDAARSILGLDAPAGTPPALRDAITRTVRVADDAAADPSGACGAGSQAWLEKAAAARGRLVRMSLEFRLVVSVEAS